MGVIEEVGEGVTGWQEGDHVTAAPWTYAEDGHGTWQEYVLVKAEHLARPGPPATDLAHKRPCKPRTADAAPAAHRASGTCGHAWLRDCMHDDALAWSRCGGPSARCGSAGRRAARGA